MIDLKAFVNELEKISAMAKVRSGSTPIRVHNLTKKEVHDKRKSAAALKPAKGLGNKKNIALVAGGIGAWEAGKQTLNDYKLGRQVRKQQGF